MFSITLESVSSNKITMFILKPLFHGYLGLVTSEHKLHVTDEEVVNNIYTGIPKTR
jgi:HD superfamily phosphohydrolase YqeK